MKLTTLTVKCKTTRENDIEKSIKSIPKSCIELKTKRIGEIFYNNYGEYFKIIEYVNAKNVTVRTNNGNILYECIYGNLKKGNIKDYFNPTIFEIGFYGAKKPIKREYPYSIWFRMMERCYSNSPIIREKQRFYDGCSVSKEWHNYQNYKKWYYDNLWTEDIKLCVDKDIINKGNKIYGENHCVLVPYQINNLFVKANVVRGECPIGVNKTPNGHFRAYCNMEVSGKKKQICLGTYEDMTTAFLKYKLFKESYIKQLADKYKSKYKNFPQKLYDAMYKYEVEESD